MNKDTIFRIVGASVIAIGSSILTEISVRKNAERAVAMELDKRMQKQQRLLNNVEKH